MIAVVDDDVSFAEEIQDLLAANGHRSVVVVTHPQASSLALLDDAQLLILDLALAATNALDVLEALRSRGSNPLVVMVSGSGSEALEAARSRAVDRGFAILGALAKPIAAAELLDLVLDDALPIRRPSVNDTELLEAPVPSGGHILISTSLDYAGSYLGAQAVLDQVADPERWLARLATSQRTLSERGCGGFVIARLPGHALADRAMLAGLCLGLAPLARSHIVLELDGGAEVRAHADALADLRLAGYGLLLRFTQVERVTVLAELPVTIAALDAAIPRLAAETPRLAEPLRRTIEYLGRRSVAALCTGIGTAADLRHARDFGFNLVSASSCSAQAEPHSARPS